MLAGFYHKLTEAGVEPELYFQEEGGKVQASAEALRRIFSNLIQNALRYGSGRLVIRQEGKPFILSIRWNIRRNWIRKGCFSVFTGRILPGIREGAGLGLASVKGLMEKMGGSVSASVHEGAWWLPFIFCDGCVYPLG